MKEDRMDGACSLHESDGKRIHYFFRKNWREETIWKRKCEDNIKIGLIEVDSEGVGWIHMAQQMVEWPRSCEHGNEPLGFTKGGKFLD